jgi:GT2 family glycosyltransferase
MGIRCLIAAPVHQRAKFLPYYLNNIYNLENDKKMLSLYFIINNSSDESESILKEFQRQHKDEYENIVIDVYNSEKIILDERFDEVRINHTYSHLSYLRNMILDKADELNVNYLLIIDTDIMIKPSTLNNLLYHNKPIISGLIWNGHLVDKEPWRFPNILKREGNSYKHIKNFYIKNPEKAPKDKLIDVDFTGAVILISKEVFKNKNIRYAKFNLGEDEPFCRTAKEQGFQIVCSPYCFCNHLMNEEMLNDYISSLK